MKKGRIIQLIASICLLLGCIINILNKCMDIPLILSFCTTPLLLAAIVLYAIFLKKLSKCKKQNKND